MMLEQMQKAMGWFGELERLGTFDKQYGFRCRADASVERAESVISELVAQIDILRREWESFHSTSDTTQEDVVRALPNDLKEFYDKQLLPNQALLVRAFIGALIREVRIGYLRLINLSSLEAVLAKRFPETPDKAYEIAVLIHQLSSGLTDISALVSHFGADAEQALDDFDRDRVVRDQLVPVAGVLFDAIPGDYWEDREKEYSLDALQTRATLHQRYASHLCGYVFSRSFNELLFSKTDSEPEPAGKFLSSVLDYWYDLASDEHRFSGGGDWARQGRMHERKLYELCEREAVWQLLDKSFFRPKDWQSNLRELQPIILEKPGRLNQARRHYVVQVYKSFVFGQWSAVFALARALLEEVVKERLIIAGGEVFKDRLGKDRKDLMVLINDLVERCPQFSVIQEKMHDIRVQGNKALHLDFKKSSKSTMVEAEQRFRISALEIISKLKLVLEELF